MSLKINFCPKAERLIEYADQKKNIIWDWNGTLLNDVDYVLEIINPLLQQHGLKTQTVASYRQIFGFPVRDYYVKMGFDLEANCFKKLSDVFHENYYARVSKCEIYPSSKAYLDHFLQTGRTQSVLSASDQEALHHVLKHYNLDSYFKYIFGIADRLAASKVQRGRELIEQSGFNHSDTILIGDTDHDLEVGRELGIDVILVSHGHQSEERLKAIHPYVV